MPELPEVESTRLSLEPALLGRRVVGVEIRRGDVCERAGGGACSARDALKGAVIAELVRHGKQMGIVAGDGRVVVVQLGMTGSLRVVEPDVVRRGRRTTAPSERHIHVVWGLDSGARLVFRDPRRFGGLTAYGSLGEVRRERWGELGPDAMGIRGAALRERAGRSERAVKAALLDQSVLAGVGNIYADEALFRAGIRPSRLASRVSRGEYGDLAREIRRTLRRAIRAGGSTIRDYIDGAGTAGRAQLTHAVYGRAGERCVRCGGRLRGVRIAQRATVFCPRCQK